MSDTYRRYRAIKQAIMQFYQPRPTGHRENHLNTLVALICGLTGGKHAHLPTIADHAPSNGATQESLIKRFTRFLKNDRHTIDGWFLPVAEALLSTRATQPIQLVMDDSVAGRGCLALMLSVVLPRTGLTTLLGRGERTQRAFPRSNPSGAACARPKDHAQGCSRHLLGRWRV